MREKIKFVVNRLPKEPRDCPFSECNAYCKVRDRGCSLIRKVYKTEFPPEIHYDGSCPILISLEDANTQVTESREEAHGDHD